MSTRISDSFTLQWMVGGTTTIVAKYFDRLPSIIWKNWIIVADSALVHTLIHTIHYSSYIWDGLVDRSAPLRITCHFCSKLFACVWGIPVVAVGCIPRASVFVFFYRRILFEMLLVPIHANTFTVMYGSFYAVWKPSPRPITPLDS